MIRKRLATLRRAVRAVVLDLDPRSAELFAAQLSIWFAFTLLRPSSSGKPQPELFWPLWAAVAASCKLVGIAPTLVTSPILVPRWSRIVRGLGDFAGIGFWGMIATFFLLTSHGKSLTWGGFAILSAVQMWAFIRVLRGK